MEETGSLQRGMTKTAVCSVYEGGSLSPCVIVRNETGVDRRETSDSWSQALDAELVFAAFC